MRKKLFTISIFLCLSLLLPILSGCSSEAPEGTPLDFEEMRRFPPFELTGLEGETRRLADFLDRITLVSFFFPT